MSSMSFLGAPYARTKKYMSVEVNPSIVLRFEISLFEPSQRNLLMSIPERTGVHSVKKKTSEKEALKFFRTASEFTYKYVFPTDRFLRSF